MSVTMVKDRPKSKAKGKKGQAAMMVMVDELGALQGDLEILQAEPVFSKAREMGVRIADLSKELRAHANDTLAADQKVEISGDFYVASIGEKAKKRTVTDIAKIHHLMGDDAFYQIATVPLKKVDDYLNPEQRAEVLLEDKSGARSLSVKIK
ncbi:hypothetical protein LCGC14_0504500 [marine sediment metagenome]|uniref:Uncharacterized protein n=1 Tax=marine sediment metagenome TaxID=412755 RepID=A0A0F9S2X8_9ZZZZ